MQIRKLEVQRYKSIAHVTLTNTSPMMVFAGANGSGKSNLVDALAFMGAVVKNGAKQALREFGGFELLHCFKFRKDQRCSMVFNIQIDIDGGSYDYHLQLKDIDKSPRVIETLKVNGQWVIKRDAQNETKVRLTDDSDLQSLPNYAPDMPALMLISQNPLYEFLTNIRVFRIDPFAAKEPDNASADSTMLDARGRNVATMLADLEKDDDIRAQILDWIELIVPGMEKVSTEKQRLDASTVITFKEQGTKARFPARLISDGTIYALCILTAVLSRAKTSGITIIEEPERGIHPQAIAELVQLMRENATVKHPIFVTTHSEAVVRSLELEELYFIGKTDGKTEVIRAEDSMVDKTSIPLDTAWLTNMFNGGLPW